MSKIIKKTTRKKSKILLLALLFIFFHGPIQAKCLPDKDIPQCRYPQGDSWCSEHNEGKPYAYSDSCLRSQKIVLIERFYKKNGVLNVVFENGENFVIPKEKLSDGIPQEDFNNIQLAKNKRRIGWLPSYMACAQSYPCSIWLEIFENGERRVISAPDSLVLDWCFIGDGDKVAIKYGFPRGTLLGFELYDAGSGKKISDYSQTKKTKPRWVTELEHCGKT